MKYILCRKCTSMGKKGLYDYFRCRTQCPTKADKIAAFDSMCKLARDAGIRRLACQNMGKGGLSRRPHALP